MGGIEGEHVHFRVAQNAIILEQIEDLNHLAAHLVCLLGVCRLGEQGLINLDEVRRPVQSYFHCVDGGQQAASRLLITVLLADLVSEGNGALKGLLTF